MADVLKNENATWEEVSMAERFVQLHGDEAPDTTLLPDGRTLTQARLDIREADERKAALADNPPEPHAIPVSPKAPPISDESASAIISNGPRFLPPGTPGATTAEQRAAAAQNPATTVKTGPNANLVVSTPQTVTVAGGSVTPEKE